jgi:acetyl-CoA synthetase
MSSTKSATHREPGAADRTSPVADVDRCLRRYGAADVCVAEQLCDAHPPDSIAFTFVGPDLTATTLTYGELRERSERVAAALRELGVGQGDRVATLMGKSADLAVVLLAIWRLGAVHVPLFTAFAPPAIAIRLIGSRAKVVVCDPSQRTKLVSGETMPSPAPWQVIVGGDDAVAEAPQLRLRDLETRRQPGGVAVAVGGDGALIHMYTSGTTGSPKGVVQPVRLVAGIWMYMAYGLDMQADDVFWNAADPGWAYGLFCAVIGPLQLGLPSLLLDAPFSPDLTWGVLERFRVTNFAAAPTVYRALRASSVDPGRRVALRCASSAGEPLTPEINEWAMKSLGTVVRDHYGQTEAGMMVVNHQHPALRRPLKAGSMGQQVPGWSLEVLKPDADAPAAPGEVGRIAVDRPGSPFAWFSGYDEAPEATAGKFSDDGRWYYTGDTGSRDADGDFFFRSRDDDVIIMAGYRIGPFEVESVLAQHPAVVECAAIAVPDDIRGEVLEAHVVLTKGYTPSDELEGELQTLVRERFARHAYPRNVFFVEQLPKTPSGKIQRFVLREQRRRQLAAGSV